MHITGGALASPASPVLRFAVAPQGSYGRRAPSGVPHHLGSTASRVCTEPAGTQNQSWMARRRWRSRNTFSGHAYERRIGLFLPARFLPAPLVSEARGSPRSVSSRTPLSAWLGNARAWPYTGTTPQSLSAGIASPAGMRLSPAGLLSINGPNAWPNIDSWRAHS